LAKYGESEHIIETIPKSGYRFKGEITESNHKELDKLKNTEAVLLGTVQKIGEQVRVNLKLLRADSKEHICKNTMSSTMTGWFG
jgi:DNA-binding winged helix-turn-helix (wHTH) protein